MGTVARQQHLQWKIPLTPRLKDGDNCSGQEKCALKCVSKRKAEKKLKGGKNDTNIYKISALLTSLSVFLGEEILTGNLWDFLLY